jgi:hypothetical protein
MIMLAQTFAVGFPIKKWNDDDLRRGSKANFGEQYEISGVSSSTPGSGRI